MALRLMPMTYADYLAGQQRQWGERFTPPPCADRFARYYGCDTRIRVRNTDGRERTGRVRATGGWSPCFMLMHRSNAISSCDLLGAHDHVVAVQDRTGRYVPVRGEEVSA